MMPEGVPPIASFGRSSAICPWRRRCTRGAGTS
jgi:hypothetical protein